MPVEVLLPSTLDQALGTLAEHPHARPIAGGTDLMVELNQGDERPEAILDVSRLAELGTWQRNGREVLGAGVTYSRILADAPADDALTEAARATIGSISAQPTSSIPASRRS